MSLDWGTTSNNANDVALGSITLGQATALTCISWSKPQWSSGTAWANIVRQRTSGGANGRWAFAHIPDGTGNWKLTGNRVFTGGGGWSEGTDGEIADDTWTFSAMAATGLGTTDLFVGDETTDAAEVTYSAGHGVGVTALRTGAKSTEIGGNPPAGNEGYTGFISAVAVFDAKLTVSELVAIQYDFISGSLARSDLASLHILGAHGTTTVEDMSGNGFTGTKTGTLTLAANPPFVGRFPGIGHNNPPYEVAVGGATRPQGPFGHPLTGPFGGPI